ncbi:hypothetical protein T484DRAFT_1860266 [Baffinella frigidus]|nr:hypothetical protein T484DRAFT_1860266 [Cryptophyta sp. CCMP2293]
MQRGKSVSSLMGKGGGGGSGAGGAGPRGGTSVSPMLRGASFSSQRGGSESGGSGSGEKKSPLWLRHTKSSLSREMANTVHAGPLSELSAGAVGSSPEGGVAGSALSPAGEEEEAAAGGVRPAVLVNRQRSFLFPGPTTPRHRPRQESVSSIEHAPPAPPEEEAAAAEEEEEGEEDAEPLGLDEEFSAFMHWKVWAKLSAKGLARDSAQSLEPEPSSEQNGRISILDFIHCLSSSS